MNQISPQQNINRYRVSRASRVADTGKRNHHHALHSSHVMKKNLILSAIACVFPNVAWALPESGQVVAGSATISSPDANTTLINQTTDQSIINWTRFNIGAQEFVQFIQPSSSSISLNRVTGGDPSSILGSLSANGHVYLVNPNGIYFGHGVQVDVSGLVASVMDIDNADFMSGNFVFSRDPNTPAGASVINDGVITARDNGYVVLMGDYAANNGIIQAHMGKVVLASGSHVTMDVSGGNLVSVAVDEATLTELAGVENTGEIYADGGRVIMTAKVAGDLIGSAVNNTGLIQANSIVESNGEIYLTASGGDITNAGTLDASAEAGSGLAGGGVLIYSDRDVTLSDGALIKAQGDESITRKGGNSKEGAGGVVRVIAEGVLEHEAGAVIDVSGVEEKGGFVEVSGHESLSIRGDIQVGSGGDLLIDPGTLTIINGNNTPGFTTGGTSPSFTNGFIGRGFIESQLNSNVNVTLVANNSIIAGAGTAGGNVFTINATTGTGDLAILNGTVTTGTTGTLGGTLNCLLSGYCVGGTSIAFTPSATGSITLNTVSINIAGGLSIAGGTASGNVNIGAINAGQNVSITAGNNVSISGNVSGAGTSLVVSVGNNVSINGGIGTDTVSGRLNADVALNAGNSVNINSNIFLANNNLVFAADTDAVGGGDVNIDGIEGQKTTVSTRGTLNISGQNFNVNGASTVGFTTGTSQVFVEADDNNALTTTDNIVINLAGDMNVTGGNGVARATSTGSNAFTDVSVNVTAGNDVVVNAAALNVAGGNITATSGTAFTPAAIAGNANATVKAGRDMNVMLGSSLNVAGGNADASVNSNISSAVARADAALIAGRNANINVTGGDLSVTGGSATALEPAFGSTCATCTASASALAGIEAGAQMTLSAMGGNIQLNNGPENTGFPSPPTITVADAGAYLSAANLSAVAGQDINVSGSFKNTGAAGGAAWFLDAGNDIIINTNMASAGNRFDDALTLSAGRNVDINADMYLENHALTLAADDDMDGIGDVNIYGQPTQTVTVETRGGINVSGQNFNVLGASYVSGSGSRQVFVVADDGNVNTTTDNITVNVAGNMNVTGGTAYAFNSTEGARPLADASVNVFAGNDVIVNAGTLNVTGGMATGALTNATDSVEAYADANLFAGRNLVATLSGSLNVTGGDVEAVTFGTTNAGVITAIADAEMAAGGDMTVNAGGAIANANGTLTVAVPPSVATVLSANGAFKSQGNMNLTAGTSLTLDSEVDVGGSNLQLTAGTDLIINTDLGVADSTPGKALNAIVPLNADTSLNAGNNIFINGNIFAANNSLSAVAGADIVSSLAQIYAAGLYMQAGGNIDLSSSMLNIGSGSVPGIAGDSLVLQAMQVSGIPVPTSPDPNARFIAGGSLDIGDIALQGSSSYLWLSASNTSVNSITTPAGADLLLQYSASNPNSTIGFEDLPDTSKDVNYNNQQHVFPFPVTTLVIGSSEHAGNITIGSLEMIDIGDKNIVAVSDGGSIDSLANVITTGIVAGLGQAVFVTPRLENLLVDVDDPLFIVDDESRKKLISMVDDDDSNVQMCTGQ